MIVLVGSLGTIVTTIGTAVADESLVASSLVPASAEIAAQIQAQATPQRPAKSSKSKATAAMAKPRPKAKRVPVIIDNQFLDGDDYAGERDADPEILDILGASTSIEASLIPNPTSSIPIPAPAMLEQKAPGGEKASILALAMENEKTGNKDCADMFFRIYKRLIQTPMNTANDLIQPHANSSPLTSKRLADQVTSTTSASREK
jgi:hypothetical protein